MSVCSAHEDFCHLPTLLSEAWVMYKPSCVTMGLTFQCQGQSAFPSPCRICQSLCNASFCTAGCYFALSAPTLFLSQQPQCTWWCLRGLARLMPHLWVLWLCAPPVPAFFLLSPKHFPYLIHSTSDVSYLWKEGTRPKTWVWLPDICSKQGTRGRRCRKLQEGVHFFWKFKAVLHSQ